MACELVVGVTGSGVVGGEEDVADVAFETTVDGVTGEDVVAATGEVDPAGLERECPEVVVACLQEADVWGTGTEVAYHSTQGISHQDDVGEHLGEHVTRLVGHDSGMHQVGGGLINGDHQRRGVTVRDAETFTVDPDPATPLWWRQAL